MERFQRIRPIMYNRSVRRVLAHHFEPLIMGLLAFVTGCGRNATANPQRTAAPEHPQASGLMRDGPPAKPGWLSAEESTFRLFDVAPGGSAIEQGCPFAAARLPPCPESLQALTKNDLRDRASELDGKEVVVIGPMGEASAGDSVPQSAALSGRQCWALTVGTSGTADVFLSPPPWRWDGKVPTPYWCCGDASATCCGVTRSPIIAARGVYRAGDMPQLEHPALCAAQPGTQHAEQLPVAGSPRPVADPSTREESLHATFGARHWLSPDRGPAFPFSIEHGQSVMRKGCPFRSVSIPRCEDNMTAFPAHELNEHPELVGRVITVAGLLQVDGGGALVPGPHPRDTALRTGSYVLGHAVALRDTPDLCIGEHCLFETRLACYGDDTGLCCSLPIERRIVARGLFQIGAYGYIYKPLLCDLGERSLHLEHFRTAP